MLLLGEVVLLGGISDMYPVPLVSGRALAERLDLEGRIFDPDIVQAHHLDQIRTGINIHRGLYLIPVEFFPYISLLIGHLSRSAERDFQLHSSPLWY